MNKKYLLILIILISLPVFAQTEFSVHKFHKEIYQKSFAKSENDFLSEKAEKIIPLQNIKRELSKIVFGYLPDWEYLANSQKYFHFDYSSGFI